MCSSRSTTVSPLRPRTVNGHDLLGEPALGLRGGGAPVGADGELVLLLARDPVLPAEVLGGLDHAAGDGVVPAAGGDPPAGQRVVQQHARAGAGAPAHGVGVEVRVAHGLRAAGEHHLRHPGLDLHRGVEHGLQPGPAAAVDLQTR